MKINNKIKKFLKDAIFEDTGNSDITTEIIFDRDFDITAHLISKQNCVLAGIEIFKETFRIVDRKIRFFHCLCDGDKIEKGTKVCQINGSLKSILKAERVSLNILSHLSGIATYTSEFVSKTGNHFKILDTRKTLPGLRELEKYAVRIGGGYNHRMNLSEMVLIKDNHINIWAKYNSTTRIEAIKVLVSKAKRKTNLAVEVEVESCEEALAATKSGADILMFDNAGVSEIKRFLKIYKENRPLIEISGGIDISDIKKFKGLDIDFVSVGRITHSAPAIDFSLEIL